MDGTVKWWHILAIIAVYVIFIKIQQARGSDRAPVIHDGAPASKPDNFDELSGKHKKARSSDLSDLEDKVSRMSKKVNSMSDRVNSIDNWILMKGGYGK